MRVLISGGTGLIGTGLRRKLAADGHSVWLLTRKPTVGGAESIQWNPESGELDASAVESFDAIIHLAGENIGAKRWSARRKEELTRSRVESTRLLAKTIAGLKKPPSVVISASGSGYYGNRGDELLSESSGQGVGFLPDLCVAWEQAIQPVAEKGIRLVVARLGLVLTSQGGALGKMLRHYRLGLGGKLGSGRQYWSWIGYQDLVGAMIFAINTPELSGPVNFSSPNPVTNREFSDTLASVLHRPAFLAAPGFTLRLALGEMTDALLDSCRMVPSRLTAAGYRFHQGELRQALELELTH